MFFWTWLNFKILIIDNLENYIQFVSLQFAYITLIKVLGQCSTCLYASVITAEVDYISIQYRLVNICISIFRFMLSVCRPTCLLIDLKVALFINTRFMFPSVEMLTIHVWCKCLPHIWKFNFLKGQLVFLFVSSFWRQLLSEVTLIWNSICFHGPIHNESSRSMTHRSFFW